MSLINKIVTLHHVEFPYSDACYGKRTLLVTVEADASDETIAQEAFRVTNEPDARPQVIATSGNCYSLSCGDVVEITHNNTEPHSWLMVMPDGFRPLTLAVFCMLLRRQQDAHRAHPDRHWTMSGDAQQFLAPR